MGHWVRRALMAAATMASISGGATAQIAAGNLRGLYVLHCAGCHAMDGSGHPAQGVPSMRGTLGRFVRVPEGRAFLVQVPGVNNAGLDDAQIAALTNWTVRQFSADTLPADWRDYTAAEVALARRARPADVTQARAELVARLRRDGVALP